MAEGRTVGRLIYSTPASVDGFTPRGTTHVGAGRGGHGGADRGHRRGPAPTSTVGACTRRIAVWETGPAAAEQSPESAATWQAADKVVFSSTVAQVCMRGALDWNGSSTRTWWPRPWRRAGVMWPSGANAGCRGTALGPDGRGGTALVPGDAGWRYTGAVGWCAPESDAAAGSAVQQRHGAGHLRAVRAVVSSGPARGSGVAGPRRLDPMEADSADSHRSLVCGLASRLCVGRTGSGLLPEPLPQGSAAEAAVGRWQLS
jgi:hypothetical protein